MSGAEDSTRDRIPGLAPGRLVEEDERDEGDRKEHDRPDQAAGDQGDQARDQEDRTECKNGTR
jgi:hypothetical protein